MTDESLFAAALAIPSPSDRATYLDRACAGDPALRQEVEGCSPPMPPTTRSTWPRQPVSRFTEHTPVTGFGPVVGTLAYRSSEQATFNTLDVDTRSDVYPLGVLLYELLAGSPPFTRKDRAGVLEMLRAVREVEPPEGGTMHVAHQEWRDNNAAGTRVLLDGTDPRLRT